MQCAAYSGQNPLSSLYLRSVFLALFVTVWALLRHSGRFQAIHKLAAPTCCIVRRQGWRRRCARRWLAAFDSVLSMLLVSLEQRVSIFSGQLSKDLVVPAVLAKTVVEVGNKGR